MGLLPGVGGGYIAFTHLISRDYGNEVLQEALAMQYPYAYLAVLVAGFVVVGFWETYAPLRQPAVPVSRRWRVNFALLMLSQLAIRLLVPVSGIAVAIYASHNGIGLLNLVGVSDLVALIVSLILLDLVAYGLHWLFHRRPLWRLHQAHHLDPDYDLTTGFRFHPLETLIFITLRVSAVFILGAPAAAVFLYDLLAALHGYVAHANVRIPPKLDRLLRSLFVTPDMHRVHHSVDPREGNSNYGAILSIWDRVFATYVAQPRLGHQDMTFGVEGVNQTESLSLWTALVIPFRRPRPQNGAGKQLTREMTER